MDLLLKLALAKTSFSTLAKYFAMSGFCADKFVPKIKSAKQIANREREFFMQGDLAANYTEAFSSTSKHSNWFAKCFFNFSFSSSMSTFRPISFSIDVTALSVIPHGTIFEK